MHDIRLPHNGWRPRRHQYALWRYLHDGGKRAIVVWHRRAGKDEVCLHHLAVAAAQRVSNFWYCLPEYEQARKAIWTAINPHSGKRRIDEAFPPELRSSVNDQSMFIRLINGSTVQMVGSDRYDATVGASVSGIVYSEWALSNPSAWAYHRPMIEENNGWALFVTTPRGRNHAYDMYKYASHTDGWFAETKTVIDTGALTPEQIAEAQAEYMALYGADAGMAQFRQEYLCDWTAAMLGVIYGGEMMAVRHEGRIGDIEATEGEFVHRAWDIGIGSGGATSIWFFQVVGAQIFILDHLESSGVGVEWYAGEIRKRELEHGWTSGSDFVPHDAKVKEWGSGRTRVETMVALDLKPILARNATVDDGINAVRRMLPLCVFHSRCEASGIPAVEQYRREWDDDLKIFKANALHDWTSHAADALRYLAMSWQYAPKREIVQPRRREGWVIPPPPEARRGMRL